MIGKIISLRVSGTVMSTTVRHAPDLAALKDAIGGGYIELVPGWTTYQDAAGVVPCVAFCDEDGKLKNLPINQGATLAWHAALRRNGHPGLIAARGQLCDYLVGAVAVVTGDQEFLEAL